jgi:hypothetical protein
MYRACRTGEIVDFIHLGEQGMGHIMPQHLEIRGPLQGGDVVVPAREEVIHTQNILPGSDKAFTKVASDEPGATGYKNTLL